MAIATLSTKHQIVIPKAVRKQLGLKAGSKITVYPIDANKAIISKQPEDIVEAMSGLGKDLWEKLGGADKYIERERASWDQ